jgi:hypothetical protein
MNEDKLREIQAVSIAMSALSAYGKHYALETETEDALEKAEIHLTKLLNGVLK